MSEEKPGYLTRPNASITASFDTSRATDAIIADELAIRYGGARSQTVYLARQRRETRGDHLDRFARNLADDLSGRRDLFHQTDGLTCIKRKAAQVTFDKFRRRHHRVIDERRVKVAPLEARSRLALV